MSYATLNQLIDRYGEGLIVDLSDRGEPRTGEVDHSVVDAALRNAAATIDSFIARRYALPMVEVPTVLADLAEAIAIYKLHRFEPDPKIKDEYDAAMAQLKLIGDGKVALPVAGIADGSSSEAQANSGNGVRVTDRDRPMTAETLKNGFI